MSPRYKRILLKLSGEALAGEKGFGIDHDTAEQIASEIAGIHSAGVQIAIVIGGGNFIRGAHTVGIPRVPADSMGMLATVMNSIAFASYLEKHNISAKVLSAVRLDKAGQYYTPERAVRYLTEGTIVLLAGGTGNPYFTTDTAAALRCAEIKADVLLKATKVDGIYDSDPMKNPSALRFEKISHSDALSKNLRVMDSTAFSFCMEQKISVIIFKLLQRGNLRKCVEGEAIGSIVQTGG